MAKVSAVVPPPGVVQTATLPQMRKKAAEFAAEWADARSEKSEAQSFWNDFFAIFGVKRRRVATFEFAARRYSRDNRGWVDVFSPGSIACEHKSAGEPLDEAMEQLEDYLPSISERDLPHTLVVCDFKKFVVRSLEDGTDEAFLLADLPAHIERFAFIAGYDQKGTHQAEEEVNVKAALLLGSIYDELVASRYNTQHTKLWLVRILYILFADDTQLWERDLFSDWLTVRTAEDGNDLGIRINNLFNILDTPYADRQNILDADLSQFAYVNGGLFKDDFRPPACSKQMRDNLIAAARFDWSKVSPIIFGSLLQNISDPELRRNLGQHYTSVDNIFKQLRPMFLDELEERLAQIGTTVDRPERMRNLRAFIDHLATINIFDPAAGSGNFLMLAYRELRNLETQALLALRATEAEHNASLSRRRYDRLAGQLAADISVETVVTVGQMHGIEIEELSQLIAITAMHLVDHQCNLELSRALGDYFVRLPITHTANVVKGDALLTDWNSVLAADDCTYIVGNPPFIGKGKLDTADQRAGMALVWGEEGKSLDYVCAWWLKAVQYAGTHDIRIAFVSTKSIAMGEQVPTLWSALQKYGFSPFFAHRLFDWEAEQGVTAGDVHVVIVGIANKASMPRRSKRIYDYPSNGVGAASERLVSRINPYLADADWLLVEPSRKPMSPDVPPVIYGSKPADDGGLIVKEEDYEEVVADPAAAKYLRRFLGAKETLNGKMKHCLWLTHADPRDIKSSKVLQERLRTVRDFRAQSTKVQTRSQAATPGLFSEIRQPETDYLVIPIHVSQARDYYIAGRFSADVISGNHNFIVADPDGLVFSIISSSFFIAWQKMVGGRVRADLRFANTLTWNTFPMPALSAEQRQALIAAGQSVQSAREQFPDVPLDSLYFPTAMPLVLRKAHDSLDLVMDRIFAGRKQASNAAREAHLFRLYKELTQQ